MRDLISRQAAIDALIAEGRNVDSRYLESERIIHEADAVEAIAMLPSTQPEPLTDAEQRIFLAAMSRERIICGKTDEEMRDTENDETLNLVHVCSEIERKVKKALWDQPIERQCEERE